MYELPIEIREETLRLIEGERPDALCGAAERLSERYREGKGTGKRLVGGKLDILAYAAARMPATYAAVSRALALSLECCELSPETVLDAGAGTGAAAAAAYALTGCADITCVEREQSMIDAGRRLLTAGGINARWVRADLADGLQQSAALVLSSYCLNEMTPACRKAAVERLWNAAQQALLIIEPGTPEGFAQLRAAREQLLTLGARIAAPCPAATECPLPADDWCHFTVRVPRTRLHKQLKGGSAPYEDEKFCFITAVRADVSPCAARVLRHPRIESGRITLSLCTPEGLQERTVTRSSPLFKAARKADCGDALPKSE